MYKLYNYIKLYCTSCVKEYRMRYPYAVSFLVCAFDYPCLLTHGTGFLFIELVHKKCSVFEMFIFPFKQMHGMDGLFCRGRLNKSECTQTCVSCSGSFISC